MDAINIPQFFVDKTIFITGGSGFMGKCIIEKLLRSCPDLEAIYLLIRPKRGKTAANRVQEILENKLFDVVRNTTPSAFEKVFAVTGDVTSLQLGLNDQDKKLVLTSHVVFHAAASVRFDDPLKKAILMNTRGTREMMELMLQMPNLVVGVHVSTTYCNTDKDVIEEKVYRDHGDWKEAIRLAEQYQDEYKLDILTNKYIGDLHNTYLLTKHLAENVVDDYSHRLPLVLFRPGIVISTWKDPIPGWNDNYNGPIGICLGVGKGILRTIYTRNDNILDYMPVDVITKAMLVALWCKAVQPETSLRLPVYNCSVQERVFVTQRQMIDAGLAVVKARPLPNAIFHPKTEAVESMIEFRIKFILFNLIPGLFVDLLLRLAGRRPILARINRKIYLVMTALGHFALNTWNFKNENFWNLAYKVEPIDKEAFWFTLEHFDMYEYYMNAVIGINRYVVKEKDDVQENIKQYKSYKEETIKCEKFIDLVADLFSDIIEEAKLVKGVYVQELEKEKFRQTELEKIRKDLIRIFDELEIKPSLDFEADLSDSEMEITDTDYVEKLERSKNIVLELRESLSPLWERLEDDLNVRNEFLLKYSEHESKTVSALRES
ncbi:fatty acyl-CoA reductase 1-like [Ctenocephalides felis]|uniref:fatty acyl-CoA reductase 1-like n=1 Tax=Ctenocephalides felis TaxID=7515 RepID=UPI000E6E43D0|nr:fatty acyl-CoA reductase 1-like [Ctenocephalides felis]